MLREHQYQVELEWQGDLGEGTSNYRAYRRQHAVRAANKLHEIAGSSDRTFHGDAERWNPEELLLAAVSQCHMLSYLHVATQHGVIVRGYTDSPVATIREDGQGGGSFVEATLRPIVTVADDSMHAAAQTIHAEAAAKCFIAESVAFPVHHDPVVQTVSV